MSDGAVYTYLQGNEYEDIAAAWDWNLIPGTTTDYAATSLTCAKTSWTGIQQFVGGASDGTVGVAAMRYTNPYTGTLSWQKTWFFLEDNVQLVMVANLSSATNAPLYSVLDQKIHAGDIVVDGKSVGSNKNFTNAGTLWHGGVGYAFDNSGVASLSVKVGYKSGNWSTIGTSTQPNIKVDLFAAYLSHNPTRGPISYTVFPAADSPNSFQQKKHRTNIKTVQNDNQISAVYDDVHRTVMVVFWQAAGGSVSIPGQSLFDAPLTIASSGNSAVIYQLESGNVTVSDPSQTLTRINVKLSAGAGQKPPHWGSGASHELSFTLPTSGLSGSSISQNISN